jgi:predicted histidine transporter YuiF (NhaC family)
MAKKKANSKSKKDTKKKESIGGLMIPAGLFIGMGLGFIYGNLPAWLFIGLGAGFLGFAIVSVIEKNKN